MRDPFYRALAILTGGIVFSASWAYAVATYGWFLGLGLGWLPAAFIGVIAGFLWPLIGLAILVFVLLVMNA